MEDAQLERLAEQTSAALNAGEYARAVALLDQLITACPDRADFHYWQSEALLSLDRCADALQAARRAVELDPTFVRAYRPLAWAAGHVGRIQEGQVALERALAVSNRAAKLLAEYAMYLAAFRAPRVALGAAQEAVNADPSAAEAWVAMGWAQFRMHQPQAAETSLRRALEIQPNNSRALVGMIELLNSTARPDQARALVELLRDYPEAAGIAEVLRAKSERHYRFLPPGADESTLRNAPPLPTEPPEPGWHEKLGLTPRGLVGMLGWLLVGTGVLAMLHRPESPAWSACFLAGVGLLVWRFRREV